VLANFGRPRALTLAGRRVGPLVERRLAAGAPPQADHGSIIAVLATDAPLDHRQLRRLATRAAAGIARTGSSFGHGSGDIALAFSTAQPLPRVVEGPFRTRNVLDEPRLDPLFDAAAEATEQAIVKALFAAETVTGFAGRTRTALAAVLPDWREALR
jgi:D-aminopeptidase